MSDRLDSWEQIVAFALALPDSTMESFYGTPCPKVNKKASSPRGARRAAST